MADDHTTVMAADGDSLKSVESEACSLPDLCPGMAGMYYNLQHMDTQQQFHKVNNMWEGLGPVQTAPPHAHSGLTHPQSQARDSVHLSLNEYFPMPTHKPASKAPGDSQFQAWFSQQMNSTFGSQDKIKTCKDAYTTQQILETNPSQAAYRSQTLPSSTDIVTLRPETSSSSIDTVAFRSQTSPGQDIPHINYRCNTPDLLMSVMQFENQALNSRGSSNWCTTTNSPITSAWPSPSPDSNQHDSGYYSEEPSPHYFYHPQTSEVCSSTSTKIPSFIPTFLPNSNSWNWIIQNTMNEKRTHSIKDINPPKIQRLVKGDLSAKSPSPCSAVKLEPVLASQLYPIPVPSGLVQTQQNSFSDIQSIQMVSSDGLSIPNTTMLHKQFDTTVKSLKSNKQAQKRKAMTAKISKDTELPRKVSRHNEPLNNKAVLVMMRWYEQHWENPYPTKLEKEHIAKEGGISVTQVKSWFANKRNRTNNTRPKVQKKQMEDKLLDLCHTLAKDSKQPSSNNAYIIDQLSSIINSQTFPSPADVHC